ncbi:MAG TPA: Smr/MutS family protein [Bdellovibrionales bacterium]|nr:Smr/MutS family protein [Bdellovibrionales bacterium]
MAKDLLDLHGCRAEDVIDRVDRFIVKANGLGLDRVRIMTGKGKGIVQKTVIEYLKLGGFPWQFEKTQGRVNEGVLIVFL